jgi:hypothetical protein
MGWAGNGNEVTAVGTVVGRLQRWRQWATGVEEGDKASSVANISAGRDPGRGTAAIVKARGAATARGVPVATTHALLAKCWKC